jgi:small subunit ribosomal protein S8
MTDPIADFLTRIRNAIIARKTNVEIPTAKLKRRLAELLRDEGYIRSLEERGNVLLLELRYGADNKNAIQNLRRVSRPGQRRYVRKDELPRIRSGLGISILTTPRGVMTDRAARQAGLGGEVICEVW